MFEISDEELPYKTPQLMFFYDYAEIVRILFKSIHSLSI